MEKISVIVPFYRTPQDSFIACINSLISQTYKNLEIIVIDDCSGCEWKQCLDDVACVDSRIRIEKMPNNSGLSAVRNYGLKICTGDYVIFVDSDDVLHHYAIQYLYDELIKNNVDVAIGGLAITNTYDIKNINIDQSPKIHVFNTVEALDRMMTNRGFGSTACGRLAKKDVWELNGSTFIEGLIHEDLASTWEVFSKCKTICWVEGNLYYYYQGEQSAIHSKKVSAKFCKDFLYAQKRRNEGVVGKYPELERVADYSNLINCPNIYMYANSIEDKVVSQTIKSEVRELFKESFKSGLSYENINIKRKIKMYVFMLFPEAFCLIYKVIRRVKGLRN